MYGRNIIIWKQMRRMRPRKILLMILLVLMIALCIVRLHRYDPDEAPRRTHRGHRENTYVFPPDPTTPFYFENTPPSPSISCHKSVHIFGNLTNMKSRPELTHFYKYFARSKRKNHEVFFRCKEQDCVLRITLGSSASLFEEKDAVIFGMLPRAFQGNMDILLDLHPEIGQTWFYYSTDPPHRVMQLSKDRRITRLKYHKMMAYRLDSDIHLPFGYFRTFNQSEKLARKQKTTTVDRSLNETNQIVWTGNDCSRNFWPVIPMMQRLQKQIAIDDFGECGRYDCLSKRSSGCINLFRKYHFQVELASTECYEYITESFWWGAIRDDVIPVVYGAPKSDFEIFAPPNSFIHISDFPQGKRLVKFLEEVVSSPDKYNSYFKWQEEGEIVSTFPHKMCKLCEVIPHIGTSPLKNLGNSSWFNGCRKRPDDNLLRPFEAKKHRWEYITWGPWGPERKMTPEEEKHMRMEIGKF